MGDGGSHRPWRFRRRLTAAFLLVAAIAGGIVSTTSYVLIDAYRNRSFVDSARRDAEVALLLVGGTAAPDRIEDLLSRVGSRAGFDAVARVGGELVSSAPHLDLASVPPGLRTAVPSADELAAQRSHVGGESYLVVAGTAPADDVEIYFFFSRADLLQGLRDFREVLAVGWLISVGIALVLGRLLSRTTLRPIREAAQASRAIAEGLLATRVDARSDDEFGAWAEAFNDMAAALERQINALAAAAERERRFTADVAHELRTPLTSMVSASELLEEHLAALPPPAQRPAQLLVDDVRRFRRLVLELLELARLDADAAGDAAAAAVEPIPLQAAVDAVVARCGLGDDVDITIDEDLVVLADRVRFGRVMTNLINNAVEHGGGVVRVEARATAAEVLIGVVDRGPGLHEEHLARVFDRFHKGDAARAAGGPGLGLAIARQHAEAQGGSLGAANDAGGGARFTLTLRRAPSS